MSGLAGLLGRLLGRRQLGVDMLAGAGLGGGGDIICQRVIEKRESMDWNRTIAVSSFGCGYTGVVCHFVYPMYPVWAKWLAPRLSRTVLGSGLVCTAIDNGVHSPLLYIPAFYLYTGYWQGERLEQSVAHLKQDWPSVASSCLALWVPVQLFNFTVVPPAHRVVFVNCWNLVWNTLMDFLAHNDTGKIVERFKRRLGLRGSEPIQPIDTNKASDTSTRLES